MTGGLTARRRRFNLPIHLDTSRLLASYIAMTRLANPVVPIFAAGDYEAQVRRGTEILQAGGIVVLPTETAYGAAALLSHPEGRRRLAEFRGESTKPFTAHLAHPEDALRFLPDVNDYAQRIMRKLWPGPVSLVFNVPAQRRQEAAQQAGVGESDLYDAAGDITLRCPRHIVFSDVVGAVEGGPVAMTMTSAFSGHTESGASLAEELGDRVDLVFDGGPTEYSRPSTILKVGLDNYQIVRQGIYDERIIDRLLRTTILFVCSGNTCRSPMSEAIARQYLATKIGVGEADLEKKGINVISAGSFATPGTRAAAPAIEVVKAMGADLSQHRSRPLTVELIHQADMIFAMSASHAMAVKALVPSASAKVSTLDPDGDIEDPIGGDLSLYQQVAAQLRSLIEKRLEGKKLP